MAKGDRDQGLRLLASRLAEGAFDLHFHSTASDGSDRPPVLAAKVVAAGLKTVALTDHDTLSGLADFAKALEVEATRWDKPVPRLIPGVELSVTAFAKEVHLLAYFPLGGEAAIRPYLEEQAAARAERNVRMCQHLTKLGFPVTAGELRQAAGGKNGGRPHLARLFVDRGYFASVAEVFDQLLGEGKPGYVERHRSPIEEALASILEAGGVPVLAHPYKSAVPLDRLVELQALGLLGVEVVHGETPAEIWPQVAAAGDRLGLLKTGGSDYHGSYKPGLSLFRAETDFGDLVGLAPGR